MFFGAATLSDISSLRDQRPLDNVFARLIRLVFAIHLQVLFWISRASFFPFVRNAVNIFGWLSTGMVYTKTIIHLSDGEEW